MYVDIDINIINTTIKEIWKYYIVNVIINLMVKAGIYYNYILNKIYI